MLAVQQMPRLDHEPPLPRRRSEWEPFHEDADHELEPALEDHELPSYEPAEHYEPAEPPADAGHSTPKPNRPPAPSC